MVKVLDASSSVDGLFGKMSFSPSKHTAYDHEVIAMAVSNSMEDPLSKEYHGLFRRRAPGV